MQNKNIIVVGSITELTHIKKVLNMLSKLQNVNYIIPENAEWIGAIGAIKAC
jgi:activator of 2-hydroxyglutaryl-CoA dehydratase